MRIRTTSEDFFFVWALNLSNDDVLFAWTGMDFGGLAPVIQTLDSAIHRINHYPAAKYYGNQLRYPLDSDLSGGQRYPTFEQPGPGLKTDLFWSEIGSGFGEPRGTLPPRIPRSTPPALIPTHEPRLTFNRD